MRRALTALLLLLAAALPVSAAPAQGGPLGVPLPLFPGDNWWNLDISAAPTDPKSATFIGFINNGSPRHLHPDFGGYVDPGPPPGVQIYGFPYAVVNGNTQPKRAVQFLYADESDGVDHSTSMSYPFYPIPDEAITLPHWIEGGEPGDQNPGGDRHMLIVDRDNNLLYELFGLFWDGMQWTAGSGAFFDMNTNNRRPEGWTSADAAGLAILPGLVRHDEVYGPDPIRHAFRVTVRNTKGHVYPASHTACNACPANAPPMGARLRLKASKDISGFPPEMQKIFQAMKTYGLIVADNGSDMYVSGAFDAGWDNDVLNPAFGALTASDFEVVKLGWTPPTSVLSVADAPPVAEGDAGTTPATFVVTLTPAYNQAVSVRYATAPGTASAGRDYVSKSGTLVFPPGATSQAVTVAVRGDVLHEYDETLLLRLSNPVNATIADAEGVATILDDDTPPDMSVADASGPEGDNGLQNRLFIVTLSAVSGREVTVDYATADGSATAPSDYVPTSGALTFPAGVTKRTIAVPVNGDLVAEADETFTVTLSNAANASLARAQAIGTILDDDALPALSIGDVVVTEGSGGSTLASLPVTLSAPASLNVTVRYATYPGTAAAMSDYVARAGILTLPPGATSATIDVAVVPDARPERNEAFLVRLFAPKGAKLVRAQGQVTILDDDGVADPCLPVLALPFTISTPGAYCLARSATTPMRSGAAVTIAADGVTFDLQGFSLVGSGGLGTLADGIAATDRKNVTVRNGTVRGFLAGVRLTQAAPYAQPQGNVVQGLKALSNRYVGIWVEGLGNVVSSSSVSATGRGTAFGPDLDAIGIAAVGPSSQLSGNVIASTFGAGRGAGFGIALKDAAGATISANRIAASRLRPTTGVFADASTGVAVTGNQFSNLVFGIVFANGSTGTQSGNVFTGVTNPRVGP
jgi:hypothetical protein